MSQIGAKSNFQLVPTVGRYLRKATLKSIKWLIFPFLGYIPYQKTHIKELEDRIEHLRELKVAVKDSSAELEPPGAGYPGGASTSERRNRDRPGR